MYFKYIALCSLSLTHMYMA